MSYRQFFTADGTFGDATEGFAIVNTEEFSNEEMETISNTSDSARFDLVMAMVEYKDLKAKKPSNTTCSWEDLDDTVDELQMLLESQYQDPDMKQAVILIKRIARALGL